MPQRQFFVQRAVFEPEQVKILIEAYEMALCRLGALVEERFARKAIAALVVDIAKNGELNAASISQRVVEQLLN